MESKTSKAPEKLKINDNPPKFYFLVENEFKIGRKPQSKNVSTINALELSQDGKIRVYKISAWITDKTLNMKQSQQHFLTATADIKKYFVGPRTNSKFVGCIRDNNPTHGFPKDGLDEIRSDLFHDVANNSLNLFNRKILKFDNKDMPNVNFEDFFNNIGASKINIKTLATKNSELHASRMHKLFYKDRFFGKLLENNFLQERKVVEFLFYLESILELSKQEMSDENNKKMSEVLIKLKNFSWKSKKIVCLEMLKETLLLNQKFYEKHRIKFIPKYLSTLLIETEKNLSRSECPDEESYTNWIKEAIKGKISTPGYSGFGEVQIQFTILPNEFCIGLKEEGRTDIGFDIVRNEISEVSEEHQRQ